MYHLSYFQKGIFVLLACLMISSCEKDQSLLQSDVTIEDQDHPQNLMIFNDAKEFLELYKKPISEIKALQSELFDEKEFTSYMNHFNSIEEELAQLEISGQLPSSVKEIEEQFDIKIVDDPQGGKVIIPAVKSPGLAVIANEYGIYQVGETLVQISYDLAYTLPLSSVIDFTDISQTPGVTVTALFDETQNTKVTIHECIDTYFHDGTEHRLRAEWFVNYTNVPLPPANVAVPVTEIGILVRHQKRGFLGIWFGNKEDRIRADGRMTHIVQEESGSSNEIFDIDHDVFNSSRLFIDIFRGARLVNIAPNDWIVRPSWCEHASVDAGTSANCFIIGG
ncbi:MAG: hypothetical protein AAFP77_10315 [Bacteroidota bacterium]